MISTASGGVSIATDFSGAYPPPYPPTVATMNKAMAAALAKPTVREQMEKHGFIPRSSTPGELATYMKDQLAVWKVALRDAGIEPQ